MIPIRDNVPSANVPVAMWCVIVLNVVIYIGETSLTDQQLAGLVSNLGVVPARFWPSFQPAALSTLFTTMFLHGGFFHLLGNMWTLFLFGDNVEDRMGPVRFAAFYLFCGVIAGVTHVVTNPGSQIPAIGASGAVAGVMGAYLVLYPRAAVVVMIPIVFYPFFFELPAVLYLGGWFVMQFFSGTSQLFSADVGTAGIAFWAHVGGFVAGVMTHRLFVNPELPKINANEFPIESVW